MIKVGILGASGFTGAELMRILAGHPEVELAFTTANQYAGTPVADLYPNLTGIVDLEFLNYEPSLADGVDIVFAGLPHGSSMEFVPKLVTHDVKVVDLSGDFRFTDAEVYETWYDAPHTASGLLGRAVYGLTELYRDKIAESSFVANPGCYPTGALLALAPLIKLGVIEPTTIIIDALSGATGAGRTPKPETLYCAIDENLTAYKVGGRHQHTPEMEMVLSDMAGADLVVSFTPHLVPVGRAILTTAYADLPGHMETGDLIEKVSRFYNDERFVKVLPEGKMPQTKAVAGSNNCHLGYAVDARAGRVVAVSAIDNLVKGAAGQAVQNMNVMFGIDEAAGLTAIGLYP